MNSKYQLDVLAIVIALFAMLFAGAATIFAGLQWSDARELGRLANDATVAIDVDTEPGHTKRGMIVRNTGPGVAHIKTVKYYVDGKLATIPITDLFVSLSGLDRRRFTEVEISGDTMGPNDKQQILRFDAIKSEQDRAEDFFETNLIVTVSYCAASGRCETVCTDQKRCPELIAEEKKRQ
jgi:hypothetical protein